MPDLQVAASVLPRQSHASRVFALLVHSAGPFTDLEIADKCDLKLHGLRAITLPLLLRIGSIEKVEGNGGPIRYRVKQYSRDFSVVDNREGN